VTTDPEGLVGFTLDNANYMLASAEVTERFTNSFNGSFDKSSVDAGVDKEVNYSFYIPTFFAGMTVDVTFDGLKPKAEISGLEHVETVGSVRRYRFTPDNNHNSSTAYVFPLVTTNKEASICKVSLKTDDKYYYTPVTSTLNQAMKEFRSLTIPNVVKQGVGRPVNITFQLAQGESEAKDINVSLVGMTRNDDSSFTINTGNNGDVTFSNGTYTIKNVVTSTLDGDLSVTLAASDYMSESAECTNRELGKFTAISLNPTSLEPKAGKDVTLTFSISADDFYDGMDVNVKLEGLVPAQNSDLEPLTRATTYVYRPNASGTYTIPLKTAEDGENTCTVKLSADGFEDSETMTVVQSNTVTYSGKDIKVEYSINRPNVNGGSNYSSSYSAEINSIKVDNKAVDYTGSAKYTYSSNPGTLTITLTSISITDNNLSSSTVIEFDCTITRTKGNATGTTTAKFTKTIGELGLTISK
jgi:hypothetical protein